MTREVSAEAELRKLAHTLDVPADQLEFLAGVPGEDLRALRKQVGEALFRADRHYFVRVATLSKTVPSAVAAKLTEATLPPLLAARTAELLEPKKAADLVGRISETYLADVSAFMDASRAPEVVAAIPPDRVASVSAELARRGEWVVIGGFVSEVSKDALAASVAGYDGEQLLRIGFVLDDLSRLDEISGLLSDAQLDQMVAAAPAAQLWSELQDLLANLSEPRRDRLTKHYRAAPASVRDGYAAAAKAGHLDKAVLKVLDAG